MRKTKLKKKSPKKISALKRRLWTITSQLCKQIYGKKCYTCLRQAEGSGLHCGHFIPSSTCGIGLRYDLRNLRPQCYNCNINLGGNGATFYRKMVEEVGQKAVDEIFKIKNEIHKWSLQDYENKIKEYEEKIKHYEF